MSEFFRQRVASTIEQLIAFLDELDGDPDFEPETIEEQHDGEEEPPTKAIASEQFVLAELRRRHRSNRS